METLHYADELREADEIFTDIEDDETDKELLEVATSLIDKKTAPFDASAYTDKYAEAMQKLLDAKVKNKKTPRVQTGDDGPAEGENVIDLMSALKESLKEAGGAKSSAKKKAPRKKAS
jgi:DNA end-binding protein Ku